MIDFSKKRRKGVRIMLIIICALMVFGMIVGLLEVNF